MLEWFVLRTHYQEERRACLDLHRQGIKSFLPLARFEQRRKSDGLLCAKIQPLFPRYLFVQIRWADRRPVLHTRGIKSFVGWTIDGSLKPPAVPKSEIKELKSRLQEIFGLDVVLMSRPKDIVPDTMVYMLFGPFRDHVAKVQAVHGSRAEVVLSLFGRHVVKTVDKDHLQAA